MNSLRVGPHALHLLLDGDEVHWAFDPRGRVFSGHRGRQHVQLGLDGTLLTRAGERSLSAPERAAPVQRDRILDGVAADARHALELLGAASLDVQGATAEDAREQLARAATWDAKAFAADRDAFARVYRPVRILPPDAYRALVIQLTEGCSYNRCAFCTLYRDVQYRAKGEAVLEAHLAAIAVHLGPAVAMRTRIFLGDANACLLPQRRVLAAMARVRAHFPGPAAGGFDAFLDVFTPPGKSTEELAELHVAGLRKVTVGLESGHLPLLEWLKKPAAPEDVRAAVERLREAGVSVSLVVLVGAGGETFAADHVRDTVAFLQSLPLGKGDTVYLSPLKTTPGDPYSRLAEETGVAPLSASATSSQERAFRAALAGRAFQVSLYDVQRWIY